MRISNNRGMTLLEILIVLGIIGALMAVLGPGIMERFQKAKVNQTKVSMGIVINALNTYYTDCGKYPQTIEGLTKQDSGCSNWGPDPYIKKVPKDGWEKDFIYEGNGSTFVLRSLGKDGKEGGEGSGKDISSEEIN